MQGSLFVRLSELPDDISRTLEKSIKVGLFQIVNITSLNPEKGIYFLHKSVQEFLAAWFINEEVLFADESESRSLFKVDSIKKSEEMRELLKFACELSVEATSEVLCNFGSVRIKENLK